MADTGEKKERRRLPWRVIALIGALLVLAALVAWLTLRPVALFGTLELEDAHVHGAVSHIGTRLDNRIRHLAVDLGDRVEKGDPLVRLETAHLEARVEEHAARVEAARARLEAARLEAGVATEREAVAEERSEARVAAVSAELSATEASLDLARREFARAEELLEQGTIPRARYDVVEERLQTARTQVRQARADVAVAKAREDLAEVTLARAAVRRTQVRVLAADLEAAVAALEQAKADLDTATLAAPADGLVVDIVAREGASVRPHDPILTVWQEDRLWVHVWVEEEHARHLRPGMSVEVEIEPLNDLELPGTVVSVLVASDGEAQSLPGTPVSPLLPEETRFAVKVAIDPGALSLNVLPGMSAEVNVPLDDDEENADGFMLTWDRLWSGDP